MRRLVVLFGGRSAEHEVSRVSAASVLAAVDRERYEVVPVLIEQDGRWSVEAADVSPRAALTGADVVFPVLHGPFGEDGTVQGLLEVADVPYVGCGVLASALAMDKAVAKEVLAFHGLPQCRWLAFRHGSGAPAAADIEGELGWPVFVKPANMGSSVGVAKVVSGRELGPAMEAAFSFDETVLVEEAVVGREIECAVLGTETSVLGEIVPSAEFYDYDDKYSGSGADLVVPAELPEAVVEEGRRLAFAAFDALRCDGMARVDFFYEEGGRGLLVNEVNTIPGFTPYSMYPRLWEASGVAYPELVDRLVELALERHRRRASRIGRRR